MRVPAVQRVAPALAGGAEVVGRHAGHHGRPAVRVELEQLGPRPDVGALVGDEDRHVADDLDAALVGIGLAAATTGGRSTIGRTSRRRCARRACARGCGQRRRLAPASGASQSHQSRQPWRVGQRHEQRVVVEPVGMRWRRRRRTRRVSASLRAARRSAARRAPAAACGRAPPRRSRRAASSQAVHRARGRPRPASRAAAARPGRSAARCRRRPSCSCRANCRGRCRPAAGSATASARPRPASRRSGRPPGRSRRDRAGPGSEVGCSSTPLRAIRNWNQ